MARPIVVSEFLLDADERLDDYVFDFAHNPVGVLSVLLQALQNFLERPFVACVVIYAFSRFEIVAFFINCVVGEVHEEIVEFILFAGRVEGLEFMCCKSDQTFFIEENFERLTTQHEYV